MAAVKATDQGRVMKNAARKGAALEVQIGDLDNQQLSTSASVLQIFELRCWARAYLARINVLSLHEAVDQLAIDAERDGIDIDQAQAIMASEFGGLD